MAYIQVSKVFLLFNLHTIPLKFSSFPFYLCPRHFPPTWISPWPRTLLTLLSPGLPPLHLNNFLHPTSPAAPPATTPAAEPLPPEEPPVSLEPVPSSYPALPSKSKPPSYLLSHPTLPTLDLDCSLVPLPPSLLLNFHFGRWRELRELFGFMFLSLFLICLRLVSIWVPLLPTPPNISRNVSTSLSYNFT